MHLAGADFPGKRRNALSVDGWRPLFEQAARSRRRVSSTACARRSREELTHLERCWPRGLPAGVIHADLFPDNVFFLGDKLSGLIDFYFACTDTLAYDVAICLNAWCFEPDHSYNITKGQSLLNAYVKTRPLSQAELEALPLLARGAALRFLLTRLVDWLNVPPGALVKPKDPIEYFRKLRFHQKATKRRRLRTVGQEASARDRGPACHHPHRRRLLRQSRAGRLGRDPELWRARERIEGRRGAHHQQPHGADGGDRGAGSAEAAVRRSSCTPTASTSTTASSSGFTAGSATAGRPPTRSR